MFRLLPVTAAVLAAVAGCGPRSYASTPEDIQVVPDPKDPAWVSVRLTGGAAKALRAKLGADVTPAAAEPYFFMALKSRPDVPVLARVQPAGNDVVLVPQAPLTRGQEYVVTFRGAGLPGSPEDVSREIRIPRNDQPSSSRIQEVYPNLPTLPANVFRFYVWFTEPMGEGKVFQHVRLLDGAGKEIPQALHEVELWAEDHRRLTLWLSPGRTKRALGITEHSGPVMEAGREYTLKIGAGLPDRSGRPLAQGYTLRFLTAAPDHSQPALTGWKVASPPKGSTDPVRVTFPEPMDRPLALTAMWITASGLPVKGEASVAASGREWRFIPKGPWQGAPHELVIDGELDDLAGNSLYRPFESASASTRPTAAPPEFRLPFRPR